MTQREEERELDAALRWAFPGGGDAGDETVLARDEVLWLGEDRYRLEAELGHGAMGEVWRARDTRLDRDVAIKIMRREARGFDRALERFDEEVRIGARLEHPGLVTVHDAGLLSDGRPWFAMRIVRGRTLADWLEQITAPGPEVLVEPILRVAEAVGHAHARGVVHRDLKPANVLLGPEGEVFVTDWGLARRWDPASDGPPPAGVCGDDSGEDRSSEQSRAGLVVGTPAYMAPEQERGEAATPRSDVHALGRMLGEALALMDRADDRSERTPAAALDHLVARCTAEDPHARPADAGEVAAALLAWRQAEQVRRNEERQATREALLTAGHERRLRRVVVVASLVFLFVASGVGWSLASRASDQSARRAASRATIEEALDRAPVAIAATASFADFEAGSAALGRLQRIRAAVRTDDLAFVPREALEARIASLELDLARARQVIEEKESVRDFARTMEEIRRKRALEGLLPRAIPALNEALKARGFDPADKRFVEGIDAAPDREALVEGIDYWVGIVVLHGGAAEEEALRMESALAQLDPASPGRLVRDAVRADDLDQLRSLVDDARLVDLTLGGHFLLHRALVVRGEREMAVRLLERAHDSWPDSFLVHTKIIDDLLRLPTPDTERALAHVYAARALQPDAAVVTANEGLVHLTRRDYARGFACVRRLEAAGEKRLAVSLESELALRAGDPEQALEVLGRQAELFPGSTVPLVNRGNLLLDMKRLEEARESFERALAIDEDCVPALLQLGRFDLREGREDQGFSRLDRALEREPRNWQTWRLAARAALEANRPERARDHATRALEIVGEDSWCFWVRARAHHALGDLEQALDDLDEAMRTARSDRTRADLSTTREQWRKQREGH